MPEYLRGLNRWVCWRQEEGKRPYNARTGLPCNITDHRAWSSYETCAAVASQYTGIGIVLGGGLVGIDLDDCLDEAGVPNDFARRVLDSVPGYAEVSPSGRGIKIYLRGELTRSRAVPGRIEVYKDQRYFAFTGDEIRPWSDDLVDLDVALGWALPAGDGGVNGPIDPLARIGQIPLPDVERMLGWLESDDYPTWVRVGMALHSSYGSEGFEIWDRWSQGSEKYPGTEGCLGKWGTFEHAESITVGTVVHLCKEAAGERLRSIESMITEAVDELVVRAALEQAASLPLSDLDAGRLREVAEASIERLTGVPAVVGPIQREQAYGDRLIAFLDRAPEWAHEFCWVEPLSCYWRHATKGEGGTLLSVESFKQACTILMRPGPNGGRADPHKAMRERWGVPLVAGLGYLPGGDRYYVDGRVWANTFIPDSIPEPVWVSDDVRALLEEFWAVFLPGKERAYLLAWIARVIDVRRPRPLWAVLMGGTEGVGKSWVAQSICAALGEDNTHTVPGELLRGAFTPWTETRRLHVIEEMRVPGHNRHEVHNRLKPEITNPRTTLHLKGKQAVTVPNSAAYYITTNYRDALPLSGDDRRFGFFWSPATLAQMRSWGRLHELFALLETQPGQIRAWYLEHRDDTLDDTRPDTDEHRSLVAAGRDEGLDELEDVLEAGAPGVTHDAVCLKHLNRALGLDRKETYRTPGRLRELGFRFDGETVVRVGGVKIKIKVWVRGEGRREDIFESIREGLERVDPTPEN